MRTGSKLRAEDFTLQVKIFFKSHQLGLRNKHQPFFTVSKSHDWSSI